MSARITPIKAREFLRTPWKNGLGHTDQIAIHPANADLRRGDYLWRVSTARIQQSAPFSVFPHHDRVLVILDGRGVRLSHSFEEGESPEIVELPALEPYEFPGDISTRCDLLDGPVQDLSVFHRQGEISVSTQIWSAETGESLQWEPQSPTAFLFAARGRIEVAGHLLEKGDAVRTELTEPSQIEVRAESPDASAVLIEIN